MHREYGFGIYSHFFGAFGQLARTSPLKRSHFCYVNIYYRIVNVNRIIETKAAAAAAATIAEVRSPLNIIADLTILNAGRGVIFN